MSVDTSTAGFEQRIKALVGAHLADHHDLDIPGFVDQLFLTAADSGEVGCELAGNGSLRFFAEHDLAERSAGAGEAGNRDLVVVAVDSARAVLRMICARLGVLCQERTGKNVSLYGDQAVIGFEVQGRSLNWSILFTNTPDQQTFTIKPLRGC